MVTPTKDQITERARRIEISDIVGKGLPALTPEDYELKESGAFERARRQLMTTKSETFMQQRKYLDEMAGEMGLVIYAKNYVKQLKKAEKRQLKWEAEQKKKLPTNGNSIMFLAHALKPKKIFPKTPMVKMPKPKRMRNHSQRTGKIMRSIRKRVKDGQKVFSFSDSVWKVKRR